MDLVDKINLLKIEQKKSQVEIAMAIDVHPPHLSGILKKKGRKFQTDHIPKLAKLFNVTEGFLLGNENEINVAYIPLIGVASCGVPNVSYNDDFEMIPVSADIARAGVYALKADGESMLPKISHGDIVVCDKEMECNNGNIVHYTTIDGESGIKKYRIDENNIVTLMPLNSDFPPIMCDKADVKTARCFKIIADL